MNVCVTAKPRCHYGSQLRRLSSEHGKMETEQRDLTEALKHLRRSRKRFPLVLDRDSWVSRAKQSERFVFTRLEENQLLFKVRRWGAVE